MPSKKRKLVPLPNKKPYASHSHSQKKTTKDKHLLRTLQSALRYANYTCVLGASNKIEDLKRTGGWVYAASHIGLAHVPYVKHASQTLTDVDYPLNWIKLFEQDQCFGFFTNSKGWFQQTLKSMPSRHDRLYDFELKSSKTRFSQTNAGKLPAELMALLFHEAVIKQERVGNCADRAYLIAAYLWRHAKGIKRIEKISMENIDHAFIAVNRDGDLLKPETWQNGYIIDAWYQDGIIYPCHEFMKKIKKIEAYCKDQIDSQKPYGIHYQSLEAKDTKIQGCTLTICPKKQPYPKNKPYSNLSDYYYIDDYRFKGGYEAYEKHFKAHQKSFSTSLAKIAFFKPLKKSSTISDVKMPCTSSSTPTRQSQ